MFNKSCVSLFSKQETCMAIITPVSVLLSLTCMLIVFWTKNDKKNDTTFLQAVSAEQGALTLRNNVRVCHSFSSVTAQLQL